MTKVFYSYFNTCGTFYIGVVFRIHLSNYDSHTNMVKSFQCKMNPEYIGCFIDLGMALPTYYVSYFSLNNNWGFTHIQVSGCRAMI